MAHSAELIERVLTLVQQDYPVSEYSFVTEKAITGTRMYPDIQVLDADGVIRCAVEIGYTRPEKLTAYRKKLKIADVRWYDKSGNLHADVQERVVRVGIEIEPRNVFVGYEVWGMVECQSAECESEAVEEWNHAAIYDDEKWDESASFEYLNEFLCSDTVLYVVTDYVRVWFCFFCDKCGTAKLMSENDCVDVWAVADELRELSTREFARNWSPRIFEKDWAYAKEFLKQFGIEARYQDADYFEPKAEKMLSQTVQSIRFQAATA